MKENNGSTVPVEVGDYSTLVLILGHLHNNPRHALREFIQNARDAVVEAGLKGDEAIVRLHLEDRRKTAGGIWVFDNGIGMTKEKLSRLPRQLCSSDKLDKIKLEGQFGVGILSYVYLADGCEIVSKSRDGDGTWRLVLPSKQELEEGGDRPTARLTRAPDRALPGTDVYLKSIHREILDDLRPKPVEKFLARHYGTQIQKSQFCLEVVETKRKKWVVRPTRYRGELLRQEIRDEHGKVEFQLYLNARADDERSLQLVVGLAAIGPVSEAISHLSRPPWSGGRIEGEIRCDYLDPLPGRRGVKPHRIKLPAFLRAVSKVEEQVQARLAELSAEQQEQERAQVLTRIQQGFRDLAREQEVEHKFQVAVADPNGEEGPGAPASDRVPGGKGESRKSKGGATLARIERDRTRTARQRWSRGLDFAFSDWDDPTRSRTLDGRIEINQSHQDFRRIEGTPGLFGSYVLTCAMREVARKEWGGASEDMVEHYLELLVGMERVLKVGVPLA